MLALISGLTLASGLCACAPTQQTKAGPEFTPVYQGVDTRLLEGDLVSFVVTMVGARTKKDVELYAECAAAQYALIRGYGFARHLRTSVNEEAGVWQADAVYTISAALPRGLKTIDAEVVALACAENGIPMV